MPGASIRDIDSARIVSVQLADATLVATALLMLQVDQTPPGARAMMQYFLLFLLLAPGVAVAQTRGGDPDARAAATEARMTDDERFQLLHGIMPITLPGRALPGAPASYPVAPTAGYIRGVARLGVPDIVETDGGVGVTNPFGLRAGDVATAMPSMQALAASFDPALAATVGSTIGREARAKGYNVLLGGGVNLAFDPRNGRNFEYMGEDPLLAGTMAGEVARGVQGEAVVVTVKHFALNAQETLRNSVDGRMSEAALRESELLAFQLAIERGKPGAVMCAYNLVNGSPACSSSFLLDTVLKRDWGFRGWVMSDWGAVRGAGYFASGLDQQSGSQLDGTTWFDQPLRAEVAAGRIDRGRVSDSVRRILRSLYAVGADLPRPPAPIDYAAGARVAREAAAAGIVLLKNDGILPLARTVRHILLVGGDADFGVLSGGGSSQVTPSNGAVRTVRRAAGPFGIATTLPSPPLRALKALLPEADISYDTGYAPVLTAANAARADLVVVFATRWQTEGEDTGSMALPEGQDALIARVAAANPRTVVVLETGNPVAMPWAGAVGAIVEAWYPGQEGGAAIADVLTGVVNPSGHLPMTFPVGEAQLVRPRIAGLGLPPRSPLTVDYTEGSDVGYRRFAVAGLTPLYPFGHGLSYTSFAWSGLTLAAGPALRARFTVENTGQRAGAAVPQLYLVSAAGRAVRRLAGFAKVTLAPGERRPATVTIDPRLLARWTDAGWTIDAGRYVFALGSSAADLGRTVELTLKRRSWR